MIQWKMQNLKQNEMPSCETPQDILNYTFTIIQKVLPETSLDQIAAIFEGDSKNEYQVAYYWTKLVSELFDSLKQEDIKTECDLKGIILQRGNKASLAAFQKVSEKYDKKYYSFLIMYLKLQAEILMVEDMFQKIEAKNPNKNPINKEVYESIKSSWNHAAIRNKVIDLAYNFSQN
jgi:flavorubredoxin